MKRPRRSVSVRSRQDAVRRKVLASMVAVLLTTVAACEETDDAMPVVPDAVFTERPARPATRVRHPSDYLRVTRYPGALTDAELGSWAEQVPQVQRIEMRASADGAPQQALFYDSGSRRDKPLLVVLHSWSANYLQTIDIPIADFAIANDWVFIHPDFRGANDGRPESTGSALALSDLEDALAYAQRNARVDPSRLYLLGYSGGAMNALLLVSRHPELFAGVSAWAPIFDLTRWYRWNDARGQKYAADIRSACGGVPTEGMPAYDDCLGRSPRAHLAAGGAPRSILIAHGIHDNTVPASQALRTFNALALADDRIAERDIHYVREQREVPPALLARSEPNAPGFEHFSEAGADVLLHLRSGEVELVLFDGGHDMLYRPGLEWLARQRR